MNFPYKKFPVDLENCPISNKKSALRPVIQIDFDKDEGSFGYYVLIDSGADYCMFHSYIGERLGINIRNGKELVFYGTSGHPQKAYFHKINFKVGGIDHTCLVGFSYEMERLAYGLLGQDGFFDHWTVKFEYNKENVEIKEIK